MRKLFLIPVVFIICSCADIVAPADTPIKLSDDRFNGVWLHSGYEDYTFYFNGTTKAKLYHSYYCHRPDVLIDVDLKIEDGKLIVYSGIQVFMDSKYDFAGNALALYPDSYYNTVRVFHKGE